jgi:hypothetical protein
LTGSGPGRGGRDIEPLNEPACSRVLVARCNFERAWLEVAVGHFHPRTVVSFGRDATYFLDATGFMFGAARGYQSATPWVNALHGC